MSNHNMKTVDNDNMFMQPSLLVYESTPDGPLHSTCCELKAVGMSWILCFRVTSINSPSTFAWHKGDAVLKL